MKIARLYNKIPAPLRRLMRLLLLIYLAIALYAFFFSERQIFLPQPSSYQDSPAILKLTTANQVQISALHLPTPQATHTLLYSHGNAEDLGDIRPILEQLRESGFSVLAYDYQGYGTSQGNPSEQNAYKDITAAYTYLTQRLNLSPNQIILYGRSVGSGPSVDLASRLPVAGVVLESPFFSAFRVAIPIPILPFDRFANGAKIRQIRCPLLIIHGTQDEVIPFWHGQKLFDRAREPKRLLVIEGGGHNDLMQTAGDRILQTLQEFATRIDQKSNA